MEKCIEDFEVAINKIDTEYLTVFGINTADVEYQQAAESAFTAELYHQYKTIITQNENGYYTDLQLHYDLGKQRFLGKRPDLVLHRAPNSRSDQRLYVEIKTSFSTQYYHEDLEKIFLALGNEPPPEHLGFKNAIFCTANSNYNLVSESISNYINKNSLQYDRRLGKAYNLHLQGIKNYVLKSFQEIYEQHRRNN